MVDTDRTGCCLCRPGLRGVRGEIWGRSVQGLGGIPASLGMERVCPVICAIL